MFISVAHKVDDGKLLFTELYSGGKLAHVNPSSDRAVYAFHCMQLVKTLFGKFLYVAVDRYKVARGFWS
jgi:hypothetical protein